jgi:hypothetical protein
LQTGPANLRLVKRIRQLISTLRTGSLIKRSSVVMTHSSPACYLNDSTDMISRTATILPNLPEPFAPGADG